VSCADVWVWWPRFSLPSACHAAGSCPKRGLRRSWLPGNCHDLLNAGGSANANTNVGCKHERGLLLDRTQKPIPERGPASRPAAASLVFRLWAEAVLVRSRVTSFLLSQITTQLVEKSIKPHQKALASENLSVKDTFYCARLIHSRVFQQIDHIRGYLNWTAEYANLNYLTKE
jgi:hypothetical protein